jgi:hypothetical protein
MLCPDPFCAHGCLAGGQWCGSKERKVGVCFQGDIVRSGHQDVRVLEPAGGDQHCGMSPHCMHKANSERGVGAF